MNSDKLISSARNTIEIESNAINELKDKLDSAFCHACHLILKCEGRVVVTGMGKSGHIGKKIAATLASTGTPAFFVHPGEASHGDLGMITEKDVVIAMSNSGNTTELITILPLIKRIGTPLISLTGNPQSPLAQTADANLDISVSEEACPLGLAPTTSTTTTLVMGDALAMALLDARGFTADDFAFSHPGGKLGRRLLLKVADLMHQKELLPIVNTSTILKDALYEISQKGLGMTTVINDQGELVGVFTDGDLRRTLDKGTDIHKTEIQQEMTKHSKTIKADLLAAEAAKIMEDNSIYTLVITAANKPVGVISMHDLLKAGVV